MASDNCFVDNEIHILDHHFRTESVTLTCHEDKLVVIRHKLDAHLYTRWEQLVDVKNIQMRAAN